jgi:uncharacterized protein
VTERDLVPFPLAGLLAEVPGTTRSFALDDVLLPLDEGFELREPVHGTVVVARTNRGVLVDTEARVALRTECARCLGPADVDLEVRSRDEVLPSVDLATGQPVDESAEPDAARLTDHHELDLAPLLREAISLAAPIAPLCRADCPGLCVVCGMRLGPGHAEHEEDDVDPRLAALRGFKVDGARENE